MIRMKVSYLVCQGRLRKYSKTTTFGKAISCKEPMHEEKQLVVATRAQVLQTLVHLGLR